MSNLTMAFIILIGARDSAIASFKVKHVDLINGSVFQDAREVKLSLVKRLRLTFFQWGS